MLHFSKFDYKYSYSYIMILISIYFDKYYVYCRCLADISAQRPASKAACALVIATGESENPPASAGGIATGRILAAGRLLELLRSQLMEYELQSTVAKDECMLRNPVARLRLRPMAHTTCCECGSLHSQ